MFVLAHLLILTLVFHALGYCEIPCGIYGDEERIRLLKEHVTTIEKVINTEVIAKVEYIIEFLPISPQFRGISGV